MEPAVEPESFGEARLFALLVGIAEKNLRRNRKDAWMMKPLQQRLEKARLHPHIAVEQDDNVVARRSNAGVGASAEAQISLELQHPYVREMLFEEGGAAIGGGVVDDDNFVLGVSSQRRPHRRQILLEQLPPIPVRDHNAGCSRGRLLVRWPDPAPPHQRRNVRKDQRQGRKKQQGRRGYQKEYNNEEYTQPDDQDGHSGFRVLVGRPRRARAGPPAGRCANPSRAPDKPAVQL